jgi:SAM-dependent methyltransferase
MSSLSGSGPNGAGAPAPTADPLLHKTQRSFADLSYRDAFWPVRAYEDGSDRLALHALLPPSGERLIEVGAGFGRLADEYRGYRDVVLLDASEALLEAARERLAGDARYRMVSGDAFKLPFPDASFDTAVCVRVIHHFEDPQPAIRELARVLRPGGVLVLESANKRDLKAIAAYLLRRQAWSPFARGSARNAGVTFLPDTVRSGRRAAATPPGAGGTKPDWHSPGADFDHAPADLRTWVRLAGMRIEAARTVSIFRLPALSRRVPPRVLLALERRLQAPLAYITPGPSLFLRAVRRPAPATGKEAATSRDSR